MPRLEGASGAAPGAAALPAGRRTDGPAGEAELSCRRPGRGQRIRAVAP
ncbi:hypothetical protein KCH_04710 [Kitasatospora cheerisanensis KCTC 2395]|uniref:Uncharacterized protein n=1 Tax=Kitasatospora cheerisanensis KCTC 2395 TaxID=1348663 RepID=A0A066Z6F9_9ACTN|nr:hypothetical protein KCH_04710 [Kitasatospora cheerisanensis KCTC 2395]